jgi:hypothetical protein
MSACIEQLKHNEAFHTSVSTSFPDTYFDWKITCLFYCAFHLIKAFAEQRNVDIGNRHTDILWNLNPKNSNRKMSFKSKAFDNYDILFTYSWEARYEGITRDYTTWLEIREADYRHALKLYQYLKDYVTGEGVQLFSN